MTTMSDLYSSNVKSVGGSGFGETTMPQVVVDQHFSSPPPPPEGLHHYNNNASSSTPTQSSSTSSFVPWLFRFDSDQHALEATGLSMDIFARATILMSSIFLGPALLELATQAVKDACQDDQECIEDGRIYGFRPSSLLSNIAVMAGLVGSVSMPIFGAIVDHTNYRWHVGAYSAVGLVLVKAVETMVSTTTWFAVSWLQVVSIVLFHMHITTTLAYTAGLTTDPTEQTQYNTYFVVVLYISTLLFLVVVTILSFVFGLDDIGTARISQVTTATVSAVIFFQAWKHYFGAPLALSQMPEGQYWWSVGFFKVFSTSQRMVRELPALKWLSLAVMFGEAGTNTLVTIGTTYMKSFLQMDANHIGVVFLVVLLMGAPGGKLGGWISVALNSSVKSAAICHVCLITTTTIAAMTLTGPQHAHFVPLVGAFWGIGLGWLLPMHVSAYISIIPRGQEAELMGFYVLSGQILSWLPPLVFTGLNEAGVDMAFGLASLDIFFLLAMCCLFMVNDNVVMKLPTEDDNDDEEASGYESPEMELPPAHNNDNNQEDHRQTVQHRNGYTLPTIT